MTSTYKRLDQIDPDLFRSLILGNNDSQPEQGQAGIMAPRPRPEGLGVRDIDTTPALEETLLAEVARGMGENAIDRERVANAVVPAVPVDPTAEMENPWLNLVPIADFLTRDKTEEAIPTLASSRNATPPLQMPLTGVDFTAGAQPVEERQTPVQTGSYIDQISSTVPDELQRAVLIGTMQTEVGDRGPIEENPNYTLSRAYEIFADSKVDRALASLSPAEQERVRAGQPSRELGMTIFEQNYEGGAAYRGRGLIQLTHRSNYQAVQDKLAEQGIDVDLVNSPELVNDPQYAVPVALAYLEVAGITEEGVQSLGPATLNRIVNPGINREVAEERWSNIVNSLRSSGQDELADRMQNRNEWRAQEVVGTEVDGNIGPASVRAMRGWLRRNNVSIPEGASNIDLVELVNRNS